MGDGETPGLVTVEVNKNCRPRPIGAQGDCYHFIYRVGDIRWAGAYWVYPSNNWGTVPGRDLIGPQNLGPDAQGVPLNGYSKVRFSAAIDALPVSPQFSFFAGGINGAAAKPPQPYSDNGTVVVPEDPSTGAARQLFELPFAPVNGGKLEAAWTQYELPIQGWGVRSVIGAFGFSVNDTENPGQTISVYVDDIVWE